MIILRVSMTTFLVAIVSGPALGQITLGDGTVVANEALADVYVGLIAGAVNNPSAIVDLDPSPALFGSLDVTNAFVVADTRSVIEVSWSGITVAEKNTSLNGGASSSLGIRVVDVSCSIKRCNIKHRR